MQHAINKAAKETHNSPQVIKAEATANISAVTAIHLPSPESLKRNIRRLRQEDGPAAQMPANLRELVVPENLQVTSKGDRFLLHDSGPDSAPNRFLIFGTERLLDLLVAAEEVFGDGTFTIPPILFAQLYLFNARYCNSFITCLYILLPNKTQVTYESVIRVILNLRPALFKPRVMMSDCEAAFINAVKRLLAETQSKVCFFHVKKSVFRHIQADAIVYENYRTDEDYALLLNCIGALAFVPLEDVEAGFDLVVSELPEKCNAIVDYFENTYIGRVARNRRRRPALFPPELWNMYQRVLDDLPRTNNGCEGINDGLNRLAGAAHLTLSKIVDVFKLNNNLNELELSQLEANRPPKKKRTKYAELDARIKIAVSGYQSPPTIEYLRKVAVLLKY